MTEPSRGNARIGSPTARPPAADYSSTAPAADYSPTARPPAADYSSTAPAAYIDAPGPPEAIRFGELPVPTIGGSDVLVAVHASAVNMVDTYIRAGSYAIQLPSPFVIGRDLVGEIVATGSAVTGFVVGQRVWCNSMGHRGRQGAAAALVAVPSDRLYPLPQGVDPVAAVAVVHAAATAYLALQVHGGLRAGDSVLVRGAGGQVGSAAVTIAARAGATVVGVAGPGDLTWCESRGAARAFDYHRADVEDELRPAAPGGFDIQLDTSGHPDLARDVALMAPRGRIIVMAGLTADLPLPAGAFYTRGGSIHGFVISDATLDELSAAARRINGLLTCGALEPHAVRTFPLADAATAHRLLQAHRSEGAKFVLLP